MLEETHMEIIHPVPVLTYILDIVLHSRTETTNEDQGIA